MTTVATPGWESGRIRVPESDWESVRETCADGQLGDGESLTHVSAGPFSVTFSDSEHVLMWCVRPNEDSPLAAWRDLRLAVIERLLGVTEWPEGTGGTIYGGPQDEGYVRYAFGPRGRRDRDRYERARKHGRSEGLLPGYEDYKDRESDVSDRDSEKDEIRVDWKEEEDGSALLTFDMSPGMHKTISGLAEKEGLSMEDFVRQALKAKAQAGPDEPAGEDSVNIQFADTFLPSVKRMVWRERWAGLRARLFPKPYRLTLPGLDGWRWYDKDSLMLHACFQLLTEFVDRECSPGVVNWDYDDEHRQVRAEIQRLYDWWKARALRPDPDAEWEPFDLHDLSVPEEEQSEAYRKAKPLMDRANALEQEWVEEDQANLLSLIAIRRYLWT